MNKLRVLMVIILTTSILNSCSKNDNDSAFTDGLYNTWEVIEFVSIESVSYSKNNNYNPVIELKKNGEHLIHLDVNSCFGSFEVSGSDKISFGPSGCTEACCDSDFSMKFVETFTRVETFEIENNNLKLHVPNWGFILLQLK